MDNIKVDLICDRDWPEIMEIQNSSYDTIEPEKMEVLESKNKVSEKTCFVLKYKNEVGGYFLSLPYPEFKIPSMIRPETKVYKSSNLHLHDIAVNKKFRNMGFSQILFNETLKAAEKYRYQSLSLVALKHAVSFWFKKGFVPCTDIDVPDYYGDGAVYMMADVSGFRRGDFK
ncbi:MAG: GNAT family N-acetyltransferase [Desulfobacteraceae bacterium]|nr:GNAT family N-acetyltransferase [Desulfobacteraceae bacterium]